jgi:hypothetical protein
MGSRWRRGYTLFMGGNRCLLHFEEGGGGGPTSRASITLVLYSKIDVKLLSQCAPPFYVSIFP